jgi:hypothetical protein
MHWRTYEKEIARIEACDGKGNNTGRHVLAAADYLYDAARGLIGFRSAAND